MPPFGSNDSLTNQVKPESIFEKVHLRGDEKFLNTQCKLYILFQTHIFCLSLNIDRMPIPIGNFISKYVYDDNLLCNPDHPIDSKQSCQLFDIEDGQEESVRGISFKVSYYITIFDIVGNQHISTEHQRSRGYYSYFIISVF